MKRTVPTKQGRHRQTARLAEQPRVLILSTDDKQGAELARSALARALVELGLADDFGVYVQPLKGWHGVYLGRHDGGPIQPTARVIEAAKRFRP